MLKGIPEILSPQLMRVLMEMGHGDELVLADGNFPAASHARRLVRADGHGVPKLLEAILKFLPLDTFVEAPAAIEAWPRVSSFQDSLDTFVEAPAAVMKPVDSASEPPIWQDFRDLLNASEGRAVRLELLDRFAFYERAKSAYAIIATGETAIYANLILKKGVVSPGIKFEEGA
jgi:L-fucose mutarotase